MKKTKQKIFILGIDGATFDVILPLVEKGKLPHMGKILEGGAQGKLHSTIPSLSAPAWIAFMTGKNPGHFGCYHFRKINIKEYQNIYSHDLINSSAFSGATFFDYLGTLGYRTGIMTVPVTYPPWKINGFMVAGYPCPDPDGNPNYTYPVMLSKELPENLNWTENEASDIIPKGELRGAENPRDILEGGIAMMTRRTEYTLKLLKKFDCDLTLLVWGAIDRAQHKLWKYHDRRHDLYDADSQYTSFINQLYCHADLLLGRILKNIGSDSLLFIVSDHGFGPRQGHYFHINSWLSSNGYLKPSARAFYVNNVIANKFKNVLRKFASVQTPTTQRKLKKSRDAFHLKTMNFPQSRAYWFPIDEKTGGLVINIKGRQREGCVSQEEYETLRSEIIGKMLNIRSPFDGKRIIKYCTRREDLYSGEKTGESPDIIFVLKEGYYTGSRVTGKLFSEVPRLYVNTMSGNHVSEGIFMAYGKNISHGRSVNNANIIDVAPTMLYALGEKIPETFEGKVLSSIFKEEIQSNPPAYTSHNFTQNKEDILLSSTEEESMKVKLKDLGYL